LLVTATARAFEMPSILALVPGIVAPPLLPRAIAASQTASQTAVICGPALGGVIYAFGPTTVYAICAAIFILASILVAMLKTASLPKARVPVTLAPDEHTAFAWLPWREAAVRCFSWSNRDAIVMLGEGAVIT